MANSDARPYPAVEAGAAPNFASWGGPRQTQPGAARNGVPFGEVQRRGKSRMAQAVRSLHVTPTSPGPESARLPSTMVFVREVLMAWRAAERELDQLPAGSPDRPRVQALLERLRSSYHRHFAVSRRGLPGS
jgi:hypothetical protein